ncbi:hypothetical protein FBU30_009377 [Linnemannia zychae]|nr:hypothetical protein FBU30_009377 [Linnemannia zychae]
MEKSEEIALHNQVLHEDEDIDIDPNELIYSLEIVQQPLRARMCGFGNKDRRNITPAPVLKLIAKLPDGRIVPASYLGKQSFVVTADLWLEDEITDRNLVLVSSIPSSRTVAFTQQQQAAQMQESQQANHYFSPVIDRLDIQQQSFAKGNDIGVGAAEGLTAATITKALPVPINILSEPDRHVPSTVADSNPSTPTSISSTSSSPPKPLHRAIRRPSKVSRNRGGKPYSHQTDEDRQDDKCIENTRNDGKDVNIDEDEREQHSGGNIEDDPAYRSDDTRYVENDIKELNELERITKETGTRELSTRNLVGQIAVCGQIAPGLNEDTTHIWFAFSILSIRTEGFFKLRFCLSDLQRIPEGGKSATICQVFSNIIHVQTPKRFEGTCGKFIAIAAACNISSIASR